MKIYMACDHAGFELKETLRDHLQEKGFEIHDMGAHEYDKDDDYPDYIFPAARKVSEEPEGSRGIVLGASGQGEAIVANKVSGVRAAVYYGGPMELVKRSRTHNNANILSLGARYISHEWAKELVDMWLATEFDGGRHERRISKITKEEDLIS